MAAPLSFLDSLERGAVVSTLHTTGGVQLGTELLVCTRRERCGWKAELPVAPEQRDIQYTGFNRARAGMAKLADAADLKSAGPKGLWGFESPSRHQRLS